MKELTLVLFRRHGEILLAMKKRGFGMGKWNGYGGKLQEGESLEHAAIREVKEESGIQIEESDLKRIGVLDFYFTDKEEWNQRVHVYLVENFTGEPIETEEMKPKWYKDTEIPYHEMWAGDDAWFPYLIRYEKFVGEIHFSEEGKKVVEVKVEKE